MVDDSVPGAEAASFMSRNRNFHFSLILRALRVIFASYISIGKNFFDRDRAIGRIAGFCSLWFSVAPVLCYCYNYKIKEREGFDYGKRQCKMPEMRHYL